MKTVISKSGLLMQIGSLLLLIVVIVMILFLGFPPGQVAASLLPLTGENVPDKCVCVPVISICGDGWFQGSFQDTWTARIRHGGAGGWRAVVGADYITGQKLWTGGTIPWPNGNTMHVTLEYNSSSNTATLRVDDALPAYDPVILTDIVDNDFNSILLTLKTSSEACGQLIVSDLMLNGYPVSPCNSNTAQGSAGVRDIKHIIVLNVYCDFTLEYDLVFGWGAGPCDEGPAIQMEVGNSELLEPDLTVPELYQDWVGACSYNINYRIHNGGEVLANASTAAISIDGIHLSAFDTSIAELNPGESSELITMGPFNISGLGDVVMVCSDSEDAVMEGDEGNNCQQITVETQCPVWDLNGDGRCDTLDFSYFCAHWNETGRPGWIRADWNCDGRVDSLDFSGIFASHWNETW